MKHAARAVIAIALGAGLAAAAQAQNTNQPPNPAPANQVQSTAPSTTVQSTAPAKDMQSTAPQKKQRHAKAQKPSKGQMNIRQVQLRLKSEGLFKGKVTGKMDRQTRIALSREQQNGLRVGVEFADRRLFDIGGQLAADRGYPPFDVNRAVFGGLVGEENDHRRDALDRA